MHPLFKLNCRAYKYKYAHFTLWKYSSFRYQVYLIFQSVSYHYESKHGTPRDYSKYDPEAYEDSHLASHTSSKPFFGAEFSKPPRGKSCQSLGRSKGKPERKRKYGTSDFHSGEEDDADFGFYDDGDVDGSFEGEFFSGEANSFETDDSAENDASFYWLQCTWDCHKKILFLSLLLKSRLLM